MKNLKNSYSSVKTVASLKKAVTLTQEQSEAIWDAACAQNFEGTLEITYGDIVLTLQMKGRDWECLYVCKEISNAQISLSEEMIWAKSVQTFLKKYWEGSEEVLNYGELRHQMIQMARGYYSKSEATKGIESNAYYRVAKRLESKTEVRNMLSFLGKVRTIHTNTFETLRGQGGKIRIAIEVPERK